MSYSAFQLRRLRVMRGGSAVYDQAFHSGLNVIRGENGSGKSTVADFIFYILGGEFNNWKTAASRCEEVQAEVVTQKGTLSLRRIVDKPQTPISIYFGPMIDAEKHALDGWETYPIRRSENRESFSQIFFRSTGIPEAQSQGASNITMNQLLRLLYSDQRTPSAFLFRYEPFDTQEIREAVGDLVCGLSVYELYETELSLRALEKQFEEKSRRFSALIEVLPKEEAILDVASIDQRLVAFSNEYIKLTSEVSRVDEFIDDRQTKVFASARAKAAEALRDQRNKLENGEDRVHLYDLEITDLASFLEYLEQLSKQLSQTEASAEIVGSIEFTHCPACLAPLGGDRGPSHCALCGSETDTERERSRYLRIKMDLDIQIRESRQLLEEKHMASDQLNHQLRRMRRDYQEKLSEYTVKYDVSTSPRDSFVAERIQRLGRIDQERQDLEKLRERAIRFQELSAEKAELQERIDILKARLQAFEAASAKRRREALTKVSEIAKEILKQDLERQVEFKNAKSVSLNFAGNSIVVDGELNFAESSNVIVKNTAILSLLLAATEDGQFYHPRFALFDNIEDKGMEQDRSHNFQEIMLRASARAKLDHQIIFTTSMLNPALDVKKYVVGPHYTHKNRTLGAVMAEDTAQ